VGGPSEPSAAHAKANQAHKCPRMLDLWGRRSTAVAMYRTNACVAAKRLSHLGLTALDAGDRGECECGCDGSSDGGME